MKKRILSILMICCMVISLFPVSVLAADSDMPFTDVNTTDWFYKEVCYVYDEALMQGTSATTFDPDGTTSRGMIVTILYRLEGEPALMNDNVFTDVELGSWYEKAVIWANGKGIVEGYGNGKFGPNDPITREQLAAIMYRYADYKEYDVSEAADLSGFVDSGKISGYAMDAMKWANAAGLITGIGASKLDPQGYATRAQVAAIFYRFCGAFVTKDTCKVTLDTCKVTFDLNYKNAGTYTTQNVKVGEKAVQPTAPTRSGYTFAGWYTKSTDGSKFDFGTVVTSDLTLYAHWTKNGGYLLYIPSTPTCTVTFDMQGHGEQIAALTGLSSGAKVTEPDAPTEAGYTFEGWYKEAACETAWNFSADTVKAATTLYAKWTAKDTAIEEAVADGTVIKADGEPVTVTSGNDKTSATLSAAQATELAGKINDLLENSAVAGSYDNKLEESTKINTTGLDAVIDELKNATSDDTAKDNIEEKTSADIDLQIKVVLSAVNVKATDDLTVTSMEFDVTPIATTTVKDSSGKIVSVTADVSDCLTTEVAFRLPIDSSLKVTGNTIAVYHEGEFLGNYEIQGVAPNTYIEIQSKDFSIYSYQLLNENNAGAKIGTTLYFKFADAVAKVANNETVTLLKSATGSAAVGREVTFTVDKNGKNFNATVSAGTGYALYKTDETQSPITYKCFPVNTQFTITYKDQGDTAFSGTHGDSYPTKHTFGTATLLVAPTKSGYAFKGWYTTSACTGAAVTSLGATDYAENITLYAKWVEAKTLGNIFATVSGGFPTSDSQQTAPDDAWTTEGGNKCYLFSDSLVFAPTSGDKETYSITEKNAEKSGDNYVYVKDDVTITFIMTGGALTGITVAGTENCNGTYTAPAVPLKYMDWDDTNKKLVEKSTTEAIEVTNATTTLEAGKFYVVKGEDVKTGTLTVNGTSANPTTLILEDGAKLTVTGDSELYTAGIQVASDKALVITGQSGGTGTLIATGGSYAAGIGGGYEGNGGTITINCGTINATGGISGAGIGGGYDGYGGTVTINGGTVTAIGAGGAGIGGGLMGEGATVTINGGIIETTGGNNSAGIGGGYSGHGGSVTINGGSVTATGGNSGAGIGGGFDCNGRSVTINGGTVTAIGGSQAAGIGGGKDGDGGNVTINGGAVTATGKDGAGAIGAGYDGTSSGTLTFGEGVEFNIAAGADKDNAKATTAAQYANDHSAAYVGIEKASVKYMAWDDTNKKLVEKKTYEYIGVSDQTTTLEAGEFYVVKGTVTIGKTVTVNGTAANPTTLILADGASLTVTGSSDKAAISVASDKALIITGQEKNTGTLTANGGSNSAGIGGNRHDTAGTITINGGVIIATGKNYGAGIGGGDEGTGGIVTVNGGTVTATGGSSAAGIGGGMGGAGGTVTVNGGEVTAIGGNVAAGIGSGCKRTEDINGGTVTINGGKVTATGGEYAAGIGGGSSCTGGNVTINGGEVIATGGEYGKAIGGDKPGTLTFGEGVEFNIAAGSNKDNAKATTAAEFASNHNAAYVGIEQVSVKYMDWDDTNKKLVEKKTYDFIEVTNETTQLSAGKFYVVNGTVTINESIGVNGTEDNPTTLILADGAKLTVTGKEKEAGIHVCEDKFACYSLIITGQKLGTGELKATGGLGGAGIGSKCEGEMGGTVTINGGIITAIGGMAGAGGGDNNGGAGIGCGFICHGGSVTINGGTVTATGGEDAAGIGGGAAGNGGTVTINGGTVTATGGERAAGIGGGAASERGCTVTINGGTVTATGGGNGAAAIGKSYMSTSGTVTFGEGVDFTIKAGKDKDNTSSKTASEYATSHKEAYVEIEETKVKYMDWDDSAKKLVEKSDAEYIKVTSGTTTLDAGALYVVNGTVEIASTLTVKGTSANPTTLILADGAKLTVTGSKGTAGIFVASDKALVITGQELGTGALIANGGADDDGWGAGAGIGGGEQGAGGTVIINGGTVTATGGKWGAGIGGGAYAAGGTVTINGGIVTANGGAGGAGIGGGFNGNGGSVTINGGSVTATGVDTEAIGKGRMGNNSGTVTFGEGVSFEINAGADEDHTVAKTAAQYKDDHSAVYVGIEKASVKYMAWDDSAKKLVEKKTYDFIEVTNATTQLKAGKFYVVNGTVTINESIGVNGTEDNPTTLILADGAKLTVTGTVENIPGIDVCDGCSLIITGQSGGTGELKVTGGASGAGIGGSGGGGDVGTVTINGGTVTAIGGMAGGIGGTLDGGAGIGGGFGCQGGSVTINGGTVTAIGGEKAAGIGGGAEGAGGTVTINGGTVTATGGGNGAAAIGKSYMGSSGTVTFGEGVDFTIKAGKDKDNTSSKTASEYATSHNAAYVEITEVTGYKLTITSERNEITHGIETKASFTIENVTVFSKARNVITVNGETYTAVGSEDFSHWASEPIVEGENGNYTLTTDTTLCAEFGE